uniref:HDC08342 n=1 Tax=Drosophila melanogaster TaxID=7227 RepID=Q6ILT8_DROME|nr:TPA_inf: HDC08342 [Drosophila melanogaster]
MCILRLAPLALGITNLHSTDLPKAASFVRRVLARSSTDAPSADRWASPCPFHFNLPAFRYLDRTSTFGPGRQMPKMGWCLGVAGCCRVVVVVVVPCCSDDDDGDDDDVDGVVVVAHSHSKRSNNEITAGTGINSIWEKLDSAGTQKDIHTYIPKMPNTQTQSKPNPSPSINAQTPSNPDTDIANTIKMKEKSIADPSKREYSLSGQLIGLWCHKLHESYGDKGHGILIKGSFTNYMLLGCLAAFRAPRLFHFLIESVIGNTWGLIRRICGTYVLG